MKKIENLNEIFKSENYVFAFRGTSFDPEKRAKGFAEDAKNVIIDLYNETIKLDPTKTAEIADQFDNIIEKYKSKIDIVAGAKSKVYSSMITGPANFPTAKNEKRFDNAMKISNELFDWIKKVEKALIKKYEIAETATAKINKEISNYLEMKKEYPSWNNTLLKGRLTTIAKHGGAIEVKEAIADYKIFTKRNGFHKVLAEMITAETAPAKETKEYIISETIKVLDDIEGNRIRIIFDYKPDAEIRTHLKKKAFKWSPKAGAWQNYRRSDRLVETIEYLKTL